MRKLASGLENMDSVLSISFNDERKQKKRRRNEDVDVEDFVGFRKEEGEIIRERYEVLEQLGEGSFGVVYKVKDLEKSQKVAIKVLKKPYKQFKSHDFKEIIVLSQLQEADPEMKYCFINLIDYFKDKKHFCIVLEYMPSSLSDFLRSNFNYPLYFEQTLEIAHQLCSSLKFLHDNKITHCDLKPSNMLLVNTDHTTKFSKTLQKEVKVIKSCQIKICDFGCATFEDDHHFEVTGTKGYDPPEALLRKQWSYPYDVWSVGCIIMELYHGRKLFRHTRSIEEHLVCMEKVLGDIPGLMNAVHLNEDFYKSCKVNAYFLSQYKPLFKYNRNGLPKYDQLFDLISKMLNYYPSQRITFRKAVQHEVFTHFNYKELN